MMQSRLLTGYTCFVQFHKYYGNVIVNVICYICISNVHIWFTHLLHFYEMELIINLFFHIAKYIRVKLIIEKGM